MRSETTLLSYAMRYQEAVMFQTGGNHWEPLLRPGKTFDHMRYFIFCGKPPRFPVWTPDDESEDWGAAWSRISGDEY